MWHERLNKAIDYIEENLNGSIDFDVVAKIMCQSIINFQRTFSIITDFSIHDYIRRRRLTLAAFELQNSKEKVINIAMKYGYESPEAFTRAFKEVHGISPSIARKEGKELKTFPRITFQLTIKGDVAMDYRIETKDDFSVYGIERMIYTKEGNGLSEIPEFWMKCAKNGSLERLANSTKTTCCINAICSYYETIGDSYPYMLFVPFTSDSDAKGYRKVNVPAATWAVFKTEKHTQEQTSNILQGLVKRVYTEWLPTANYQKLDGYEMELYYQTDDGMFYCEEWVRVIPK